MYLYPKIYIISPIQTLIINSKNYNKFKMFSGGLPTTALLFFTTIGLCNNIGNFIKNPINSSSLKFIFLRLFFLYSSSPVLRISLMDNLSYESKSLTSFFDSLLSRYKIIFGSIFLLLIISRVFLDLLHLGL